MSNLSQVERIGDRVAMGSPDRRFWPFPPKNSIVWTTAMLVGLLFILAVAKAYGVWPIDYGSDTAVLAGLVVVSLLPVLLAVLDVIIERGGAIEYAGVKINFSRFPQAGMPMFTVPANIGIPSQPVSDSSTTQILDALTRATNCEVITIDLGDGDEWWETRLLVLLTGAVRQGRPAKIVFVGKEGGVDGCLQGWGYSTKLFPYLLKAHPQYLRSYHAAQAAARQWGLVELVTPPHAVPPPFVQPGLATQYAWMAFDAQTGLPNTFLAEQLLASELGQKIESEEGPRPISLVRLKEIFQPVLYRFEVDTAWPEERQFAEFFGSESEYVAITQKGRFLSLASRLSLLNAIVKGLVQGQPANR